jgi:site-specific DNA recombinase
MRQIPAVIYAAKSTPDPKDSVRSQIDRVQAQLEHEDDRFLYAPPFSEENVSGYRRSRGPQLDAAISAAKRAASEHGESELWVFHSSRLARGSGRIREARALGEVFYDLRRHGVTLRSVEDDPYVRDEAFVGMASKMANKYSEDLAAHVQRGKRNQFGRGERLGGPVPDGYLRVEEIQDGKAARRYVEDPERAPLVRRAAQLALDGLGAPAIARRLNAEGYRTKRGKGWTRRRIQDMLSNPFYAGRTVIHRGTPRQEERAADWPALIEPRDFDRIRDITANRDKAAKSHQARTGRHTTRYALAKLGRCDRCGERMYCVTSPYVRKDGTRLRSYVCANVRDETGLCNQPKVDAAKIDTAIVAHLNRLFIDFEAWLAELAQGAEHHRSNIEADLAAELDELTRLEQLEAKLQRRYLEAVEAGDANQPAIESSLNHVLNDQEARRQRVRALQEQLAIEPTRPPVDAMLDIYNDLARAVRGGAGESLAELNDRLRAIFEEFRLDCVDTGVVGVLPVLRADVIARYQNVAPMMADYDGAIPTPSLPDSSPIVLWATDPPPSKSLRVPTEMGLNTHE